jgi:hypothetical protein
LKFLFRKHGRRQQSVGRPAPSRNQHRKATSESIRHTAAAQRRKHIKKSIRRLFE